MRSEHEVFDELKELCTSSGYIHAFAYICFKDLFHTIGVDKNYKVVENLDVAKLYSHDRLIRSEMSTLHGLLISQNIDYSILTQKMLENYIIKTDSLLKEIHQVMLKPSTDILKDSIKNGKKDNPFIKGECLREPIFYSAESAYDFQYLEMFLKKYEKDNQWFIDNKGIDIHNIVLVVKSIILIQINKADLFINNKSCNQYIELDIFKFYIDEVLEVIHSYFQLNIESKNISNILDLFIGDSNKYFISISDYNVANSHPLIKENGSYYLFQINSLLEALYESPFYWFNEDKEYLPIATKNRGLFTENISAEILAKIFGKNNVYQNIDIYNGKDKVGEIDVLVVFFNRAIVLQAKSKKLTLEARKGNDKLLANDFKKAIQDSYNQGYECASFIQDDKYKLISSKGLEISLRKDFKEIYIFCVLSEHYPSLAFQSRQFLQYTKTDIIKPPFIMDVFLLDVMTEMLNNPLYFLSYINKRTEYIEKFMVHNEITLLSYHLQKNLYIENDINLVALDESIAHDLDYALYVRKKGYPGDDTPDGILTRYQGTLIGNFLDKIKFCKDEYSIEIGFFLLTLSEETIFKLNDGVLKAIELFFKDNKSHDFSIGIANPSLGLTIHVNTDDKKIAYERLIEHCNTRKYLQRSDNWFGLCLNPFTKEFKFGVMINKEWSYSKDQGENISKRIMANKKIKIGRNDECPCGSGKKFKKCCNLNLR